MIFSLSLSIIHGMEPYLVMENEQMYLESVAWKNTSIDPDQNMCFLLISFQTFQG